MNLTNTIEINNIIIICFMGLVLNNFIGSSFMNDKILVETWDSKKDNNQGP